MSKLLALVVAVVALAASVPAFAGCAGHEQTVSVPEPVTTAGDEAKTGTSG